MGSKQVRVKPQQRQELPVRGGSGRRDRPLTQRNPSSAPCLSLGVLDEQAADEVLGQLAGVAEILLVEVVVDSRYVGQGLLLRFTQERGRSAQPAAGTGCDAPKRRQPKEGDSPCSTRLPPTPPILTECM